MRREVQPGEELANYRIEAFIGRGGMGVVYLAEDPRLGRKVALKVLAPELADEAGFRERFEHESRMAAAIDHPNIIPVYAAGEADGHLFIAMRYVEGTDLRALIRNGSPLDPRRVLSIVRQVASALDAAHARGLVHRDVKPANVLLAPRRDGPEHVYLTDFGLTKRANTIARRTATGQAVGSIDYMAPEQIKGYATERQADIYALGCVLYESLTGSVPFDREEDLAVMYAHLHETPPPPSGKRPELGSRIDRVIARAMAKEQSDRHPTCVDLVREAGAALLPATAPVRGRFKRSHGRDLEGRASTTEPDPDAQVDEHDIATQEPPGPPRTVAAPKRPSARQRTLVLVGLLLAGLTVAGFLVWRNREASDEKARGSAPVSELFAISLEEGDPVPLTDFGWSLGNPAWSPDGSQIAFGANQGGNADIYVMNSDGSARRRLTEEPTAERQPAWSPDGKLLAFIRAGAGASGEDVSTDIFVMDLETGEETQLTDTPNSESGPVWSPDGERIAFVMTNSDGGATDLFVMNTDGTGVARLTSTTPSETGPNWSPDGERLVYQRGRGRHRDIYTIDVTGGPAKRVTDTAVDESGAVFLRTGP